MRMVTVVQAKHSCRKVYVMFAVHVSSDKGKDFEDAEIFQRFHVLQKF